MLNTVRNLDRRRLLAILLTAGSAAILAAGLVGLVSGLQSDVDLPNEGHIAEITGDQAQTPGQGLAPPTQAPNTHGPLPIRLLIPGLYIDAPVIVQGVDEQNMPRVPERPDQVAWYDFSATPGMSSNAVFAGHVDWQTRDGMPIPGVFYRLREMKIGDTIAVTLEDGQALEYRVTGNVAVPYDDPNVIKVMNPTDRDVITLITCGGTWLNNRLSPTGGNYSHRVIVRAERVTASAGG